MGTSASDSRLQQIAALAALVSASTPARAAPERGPSTLGPPARQDPLLVPGEQALATSFDRARAWMLLYLAVWRLELRLLAEIRSLSDASRQEPDTHEQPEERAS